MDLRTLATLCEAFSGALARGFSPSIPEYLEEIDEGTRPELLRWLISSEMEHRWGLWSRDAGHKPDLLEFYLNQFPGLLTCDTTLGELARWEFLCRQHLGDRPFVSDVLRRFPMQASGLEDVLRRDLDDCYGARLVFAGKLPRKQHVVPLCRRVLVGRRAHAEVGPVQLVNRARISDRFVVAEAHERSVALQHFDCELLARGTVIVRNWATESVTAINSEIEMLPGETYLGTPPFTIHAGPKSFRIEGSS